MKRGRGGSIRQEPYLPGPLTHSWTLGSPAPVSSQQGYPSQKCLLLHKPSKLIAIQYIIEAEVLKPELSSTNVNFGT